MICPSDAYSTGWSILIQITSYKEQARNPRDAACGACFTGSILGLKGLKEDLVEIYLKLLHG